VSAERRAVRIAIQVLWPAFVVAAATNAVFFTVFDPHDLTAFGQPLELPREAAYTLGFLLVWCATAASSALTLSIASKSGAGDAGRVDDVSPTSGEP